MGRAARRAATAPEQRQLLNIHTAADVRRPRQQQRLGRPGGAQFRCHDWAYTQHPLLLLSGGPGEPAPPYQLASLVLPAALLPNCPSLLYRKVRADTALQVLGFSREYSFVSSPPTGMNSTMRFLAVADLGHVTSDGSAEIDHIQARDPLNYTPVDTLEYVSAPCLFLAVFSSGPCVTGVHCSARFGQNTHACCPDT